MAGVATFALRERLLQPLAAQKRAKIPRAVNHSKDFDAFRELAI